MEEGRQLDKKSIKTLKENKIDWGELAKDCVCFANGRGGMILLGIEDGKIMPPSNQEIPKANYDQKIRKAIQQRTQNVAITVASYIASKGGEYIAIKVLPSLKTIAATSDGKYYMRVADKCQPVMPEEMSRLASDKDAFIWELQTNLKVTASRYDQQKFHNTIEQIRSSGRVSDFLKEKSNEELLEEYFLKDGSYLTNLGVLWIGHRKDRARLRYAPCVQFIRYNEQDEKVKKITWDNFNYNPQELLESVIQDIPDWQESFEISEGVFRKNIPHFEIEVIRELVANALVHRNYAMQGDIFINLYPDHLEIHSPGRLPLGVTPENILHKSVRRNEHLAKLFYDLRLMEREGSGYDKIYELLLSSGKPVPQVIDQDDRVIVNVKKQIVDQEIIKLIEKASRDFHLRQREIISLGLIAQHNVISAIDLSKLLNQKDESGLKNWLGRLKEVKIIQSKGKKRSTEYFINPDYLKRLNFKGQTDLKRIEKHRLKELIYEDLKMYPDSSITDIHTRVASELKKRTVKQAIDEMIEESRISKKGSKRWTRYYIK